jgi:hypothetical protein
MRTEPHPLPTEPCASLLGFGSHSRLLSNAPLHHHLPPTPTPAAPRPLSRGASVPGNHLVRPFSLFPQAATSWPPGSASPSPSSCPRTGTLPNTMGRRKERAAGAGQVSSACLWSGSWATRSPLLLPPRSQWGSKCSLDLGGLTAAARSRRCRRAASRARARQGRGRGPRRLLVPLSWR